MIILNFCQYPIRNSTITNGIVLDPFLGSGSTLIAGEKTDHVCRGIEFDPKFVDVIVKRYIVNIKWLFVLKLKFFLVQSSLVQSSLKEYNKKDKIQKELPT